ncbi:hypothetical protein BDV96DRAFT_575321 [Lophiotrema nucula]|uniref:Uncharacterized protein n=1 Tax=Lophiotrema nucula TaxID=690887 RepID=A0A6A5Z8E6_9PLEO|nr:hypothetical protein BDV96DRAFT_575321 [Lophiotrema nucula]
MAAAMGPFTEQSLSPLLRLPGELRNRIYEYTTFEPHGLFYGTSAIGKPTLFSNFERTHECNQLKYACRQLYAETKGLGLGCGMITFAFNTSSTLVGSSARSVVELFLDFVISLDDKWFARLSLVVLKAPTPPKSTCPSCKFGGGNEGDMKRLIQLCRNNSHLTVRVDLPGLHFNEGYRLLTKAIPVILAFRDIDIGESLFPGLFTFDYTATWAKEFRVKHGVVPSKMCNFRLVPQGQLNTGEFRESVAKFLAENPRITSEVGTWLSYAETWSQNGL